VTTKAPRIALISLEPWDDTWRRNQHLVHELIAGGQVREVLFVEPAARTTRTFAPERGVTVVRPRRLLPKRLGGHLVTGLRLRASVLRGCDVLWVNDPEVGAHCLGARPTVYDVTDDWRTIAPLPRIRRRICRAENRLARRATTVVCSSVLAGRWRQRYGVDATVVPNGVDAQAYATAVPHVYPGRGPHVGYVGTLSEQRLDVDLLVALATRPEVGAVHLVGPDALSDTARDRLLDTPKVVLHPSVPSAQVPSWITGLDLLVCPHVVTEFTLSLDAIKSREYLASGRPVLATPTSGFQDLGEFVTLADQHPATFAGCAAALVSAPPPAPTGGQPCSWARRAEQFAVVLTAELG